MLSRLLVSALPPTSGHEGRQSSSSRQFEKQLTFLKKEFGGFSTRNADAITVGVWWKFATRNGDSSTTQQSVEGGYDWPKKQSAL